MQKHPELRQEDVMQQLGNDDNILIKTMVQSGQ
jgi:hypothetical protein